MRAEWQILHTAISLRARSKLCRLISRYPIPTFPAIDSSVAVDMVFGSGMEAKDERANFFLEPVIDTATGATGEVTVDVADGPGPGPYGMYSVKLNSSGTE